MGEPHHATGLMPKEQDAVCKAFRPEHKQRLLAQPMLSMSEAGPRNACVISHVACRDRHVPPPAHLQAKVTENNWGQRAPSLQ